MRSQVRLMAGRWVCLVVVLALIPGCMNAAPRPTDAGPATSKSATAKPATPKRIVAGLRGDPAILSDQLGRAGAGRILGTSEIERLLHPGLVVRDNEQTLRPVLVEAVPSVDAGSWQVFADGRMVTTYRIRPNAMWHDGAPFTSADLVFTLRVISDPDLAEWKDPALTDIESVAGPDPMTVVVTWKRPFIAADAMFTGVRALPHPKHILEQTYLEHKGTYNTHAYWSEAYVGTGGYRLREFVRGSHLILEANDGYVLGRPRVDEVEIKLVQDANALAANILAGAVDLTLTSSSLTLDQVATIRDQHWDGRLRPELIIPIGAFPQFINPTPQIILEVPFRRALIHAVDRQLLVDTLQYGLSQVAHTNMVPDNPEFKYVEPHLVKYAYDPRAAAQLIEGLGYTRGADGGFRGAGGERLAIEARVVTSREVPEKTAIAVTNMWQQAGIGVDLTMLSLQQGQDREFRQTRPGFEIVGQPEEIYRFHSNQIPSAENRYVGDNRMRYANPQLDDLVSRYYVTIPSAQRAEILGQMYRLLTDQVVLLSFFYEATQRLEASKLENFSSPLGWNVQEWDLVAERGASK
jgi:peptide/nickel transport system substrate-binding protein